MRIRLTIVSIGLAITLPLAMVSSVSARAVTAADDPVEITISGTITDHGKPVPDLDAVAWCGDLDHLGGDDDTDQNGWYEIHTNSNSCPIVTNAFLEIYRNDVFTPIASADFSVHPKTTVNVMLDKPSTISVPEFDWIGGVIALAAGGGAVAYGRRRFIS